MNNGTQFAVALILFWISGVSFFVAFHPGGIKVGGRPAQNPADVLRYFIELANKGSAEASTPPGVSPTPVTIV